MKELRVSDEIHRELRKMDTDWEGADVVLERLVRFYKKHHGVASTGGAKPLKIHTKTKNPDDIKIFIRQKYQGKKYHEAATQAFLDNKQTKLTIESLVNTIFKFPDDERKIDRRDRAASSLWTALKHGTQSYKFIETDSRVFRLNVR